MNTVPQSKLNYVRPGKPVENAFAESFSGRFSDERPNTNWFLSLDDARDKIEEWRRDYNEWDRTAPLMTRL